MVRFGRVEGIVTPVHGDGPVARTANDPALLQLTVWLETGSEWRVIRDEVLTVLRAISGSEDLVWHADQWTQETIGVDLAQDGWEAIGSGPIPDPAPGQPARSATYAVRQL